MNRTFLTRIITRKAAAVTAALLLCTYHSGAMADRISVDDAGKDAISKFLLNFGRFIDWPETAFASPTADFKVCVLGENHLGSALEQSLRNKKAGDHAFVVTELSGGQLADAKSCNILFVSSSEEARVKEITSAVSGGSVLTVGEVDAFPENGGMIGLASAPGGKLAIRMQKTAIANANLEVREQLMRAIQ